MFLNGRHDLIKTISSHKPAHPKPSSLYLIPYPSNPALTFSSPAAPTAGSQYEEVRYHASNRR